MLLLATVLAVAVAALRSPSELEALVHRTSLSSTGIHERIGQRLTWRMSGTHRTLLPDAATYDAGEECVFPPINSTDFATLLDMTGRRTNDYGDYDKCRASGYSYCLLQLGGVGVSAGICIPSVCTHELLTAANNSQFEFSLAGEYVLYAVQMIGLYELVFGNMLPITITCGDGAHTAWSAGAVATVVGLVALATAVAAASLYDATTVPPPKGAAPERPIAVLARRISLATTLPPLLSPAPRRHRDGSADLGAMDAIRVLSTCCVILGHTVYFATGGAGYVNFSDLNDAVLSAAGQVIPSAEFAVDSFFVLSGCLGAYLLSREVGSALPLWLAAVKASSAAQGDALQPTEWLHVALARLRGASGAEGAKDRVRLLDEYDDGIDDNIGGGVSKVSSVADASSYTWSHVSVVLSGLYASLVVHRFLRLAPALWVTMFFMYYVMPMVSSGPLWFMYDDFIAPCDGKYFWLTAFFVSAPACTCICFCANNFD